jgi:hypothetical protein
MEEIRTTYRAQDLKRISCRAFIWGSLNYGFCHIEGQNSRPKLEEWRKKIHKMNGCGIRDEIIEMCNTFYSEICLSFQEAYTNTTKATTHNPNSHVNQVAVVR